MGDGVSARAVSLHRRPLPTQTQPELRPGGGFQGRGSTFSVGTFPLVNLHLLQTDAGALSAGRWTHSRGSCRPPRGPRSPHAGCALLFAAGSQCLTRVPRVPPCPSLPSARPDRWAPCSLHQRAGHQRTVRSSERGRLPAAPREAHSKRGGAGARPRRAVPTPFGKGPRLPTSPVSTATSPAGRNVRRPEGRGVRLRAVSGRESPPSFPQSHCVASR